VWTSPALREVLQNTRSFKNKLSDDVGQVLSREGAYDLALRIAVEVLVDVRYEIEHLLPRF
jgi:predicted RNA-binding protein YlqC (UPF0109 family)